MPLSSTERKALRGKAHSLKPVLQTGASGLTDAVLQEAEIAIEHHELIKIKFAGAEKEQRAEMAAQCCKALKAEQVGLIGNTLILYRKSRKS